MAIIEVNNVTKEYRLGQLTSLKQNVLNGIARLRGDSFVEKKPFKALDGVDFKIEAGEVIGVIGVNGAGKSTLLKILAGITKPTSGSVSIKGIVAPLIEVGAGLHPELTGRENIFLNASILGISRSEIRKKYDKILEFSEVEKFIDTPVKRYSSGMTVRLAFSIATSVNADILIVDEVLAVGDLAFQRKCFDRMEDMIRRQGKTVLLVSHNVRQVERICTRVILLDQGKVLADGDPNTVCNLFYDRSDKKIHQDNVHKIGRFVGTKDLDMLNVYALNEDGEQVDTIESMTCVTFVFRLRVKSPLDCPSFVIGIHTTDFVYIGTKRSPRGSLPDKIEPGLWEIQCRINDMPLLPGVYSLRLCVDVGVLKVTAFYAENIFHFHVKKDGFKRSESEAEGFIDLTTNWQVLTSQP